MLYLILFLVFCMIVRVGGWFGNSVCWWIGMGWFVVLCWRNELFLILLFFFLRYKIVKLLCINLLVYLVIIIDSLYVLSIVSKFYKYFYFFLRFYKIYFFKLLVMVIWLFEKIFYYIVKEYYWENFVDFFNGI